MNHQFGNQPKTLLLLASRYQEKTNCKVKTLGIPHMWEIQGYFFQHFFQSFNIMFIAKIGHLGKCSCDIFGYLCEAWMGFIDRFLPEEGEWLFLIRKDMII